MKIYKATLDKATRILTSVVFLIIPITIYSAYSSRDSAPIVAMIFMVAVFAILFPACYVLSVKHFVVDDDKLIIRKHFGLLTEIRFIDIESTALLNNTELGNSIRVFGNGGFFGYFGTYRNKQLGNFKLYATRTDHWVLLRLKNGKKVVISPDDAAGLNQLVSEHLTR